MKIRTYTELIGLKTFEERFDYLRIREGSERFAFGADRYINQNFYRSKNGLEILSYVEMNGIWESKALT